MVQLPSKGEYYMGMKDYILKWDTFNEWFKRLIVQLPSKGELYGKGAKLHISLEGI